MWSLARVLPLAHALVSLLLRPSLLLPLHPLLPLRLQPSSLNLLLIELR